MSTKSIMDQGYGVMLYDIRQDKQAVGFLDDIYDIDRTWFNANKTYISDEGCQIACFPMSKING